MSSTANKNINREQLIEVIWKKQGVLSQVARELGCSLPNIYWWRDKYATVAEAIVQARNTFDTELVDEGEIKLREAVREGKAWAIRYALDNKGKHLGYGVKSQESRISIEDLRKLPDDDLLAIIED